VRSFVAGAALVAALAFGLGALGCAMEKKIAYEPGSDATQVIGTLANKDDQRPVDGPMWLVVQIKPGLEERVMVESIFKPEPPTTVELALQQKVDQLKHGDRLTVTGKRNAEGTLVAERIEILEP
jgi:hypothetical protein